MERETRVCTYVSSVCVHLAIAIELSRVLVDVVRSVIRLVRPITNTHGGEELVGGVWAIRVQNRSLTQRPVPSLTVVSPSQRVGDLRI